ncbi:MAG TPA: nucleotidyltransferase domain-containing protein [Micropepsaceae bacterium]|nr:nucleotidyltransferase domain-containing protein [Micropepsaceae bacterium]
MNMTADQCTLATATEFTQRLGEVWSREIGGGLCGIYRIGSLAHGGFNGRYSDIDVAVIVDEPFTPNEVDRMRATARELSSSLAAKLSIFWADRNFRTGRFPPLDRMDYLDHGAAIVERERIRPERPSLVEIRDYLRGQPLSNWSEQVRHFMAESELGPDEHKTYLRSLLYPARFVYSWAAGAMASNDDAVAFVQKAGVAGLDVELITRALQFRQQSRDLDALFPERMKLADQVSACTAVISQ